MPRTERLYLLDIVEAAAELEEFVAGQSFDSFTANRMLRRAVLQLLIVIGEASARVSEELRSRHPEIPWTSIIGFRNRAIHAYFAVKWSIVWEAATREAPELARQVADILNREYPPPPTAGAGDG